jgi:hypothetical protein
VANAGQPQGGASGADNGGAPSGTAESGSGDDGGSGGDRGRGGTGTRTNGGTSNSGTGATGAGPEEAGGEAGRAGEAGDGAGGEATAGAAGAAPDVISLAGLSIEENPNMTTSCYVSWHTDVAASSRVDFGESDYTFRIEDELPVVEHRMLVIGMHADTLYKIMAFSAAEAGTGSVEGSFTTGPLPADFPLPTLTVDDAADGQTGWTLLNVNVGTSLPTRVVALDEMGLPVWYFIDGTHPGNRVDVATELYAGHVLVGPALNEPAREVDLAGNVVWEGPPNASPNEYTHDFEKLSNGDYVVDFLKPPAADVTPKYPDELLEEMAPDFSAVWSWRLLDHVPRVAIDRAELCHGNAMFVDEAANKAYYNCRFLGIFKIDRASGDIEWRLGGKYDTTSLGPGDFTYDPPASQFDDVHAPEFHADGTVLVYDNGGYGAAKLPPGSSYHSRVVEYQLDETSKTAKSTFEFPGSFDVDDWYKTSWYTPAYGAGRRLANGNILVTAGILSASAQTRIFEVTRDGRVVWALTFPTNVGSYRANRLSPPPLVTRIR